MISCKESCRGGSVATAAYRQQIKKGGQLPPSKNTPLRPLRMLGTSGLGVLFVIITTFRQGKEAVRIGIVALVGILFLCVVA